MIFLINSWKAVHQAVPDRARERSTRLLVVEAFRIHIAFLLGSSFGWSRISLSANVLSEISVLVSTFLLDRVVEDVVRVLVVLVILVVATEQSTIRCLVFFCLRSSSATCKFKCNTEVSQS